MANNAAFDLKAYLAQKRAVVDAALELFLPEPEGPAAQLIRAMKYSLFAGGKRLRPVLCIAGAASVGGKEEAALPVACALELIHTYSLIHDDLPAMDDDDLRRGKPASHKAFGEALAILAGDALLTHAFHLMTSPELNDRIPPRALLRAARLISGASGYDGMVGGQAVDIQSQGKEVGLPLLEYIHSHKTAALIRASVASGALVGGGDESRIQALAAYGEHIGMAFQISDDILDVEGDTETLGKPAGGDQKKGKITYPSFVGLVRAKEIRSGHVRRAMEALSHFDDRADPLRHIARYVIERRK